jgi:uncharacterized membrane protein YobD (UPF0266 family)
MLNSKIYSKRGQIGETVSWLIATLVIIGILILFIWASVLMANVKGVGIGNLQTDLAKESLVLTEKTALSNVIMDNKNKDTIDNILQNENK